MLEFSTYPPPRLRNLDIKPFEQHGRPYLLLRDPLQITDKQVLVPQPLAFALALCDGKRQMEEVCELYNLHSGYALQVDQLVDMMTVLSDALMLDDDRSARAIEEFRNRYHQAPFREPFLAGRAYPQSARELARLLDGYLSQAHNQADALDQTNWLAERNSFGLLSPHIDYQRGGKVYAQVWGQVAETAQAVDLVVMFGTDHAGSEPFTLTHQHYATPYGILPTHSAIVDKLASVIGEETAFAGELRHKAEHSLELVAVWLHHMRHGTPCNFVPILVGSMHPHIFDATSPAEDPMIQSVLQILCQETEGLNVLVVASGDLAHVGPAFGGKPLDAPALSRVRKDDEQLLEHMRIGNSEGFFEEIREIEDKNNVCGVTPIYLTMRLLESLGNRIIGQVTGYDTCSADVDGLSVVTIGGMIFH